MNTLTDEQYVITKMALEHAKHVVTWQYESIYARYNMDNSPEDIAELMDGTYYAVCLQNELVGYFCFGANAQVKAGKELGLYDDKHAIDIGLGMRPDLTGKGLGYNFVRLGMAFAYENFGVQSLRLSVASFNQRAKRLYESVGFKEKQSFINGVNEQATPFILMLHQKDAK